LQVVPAQKAQDTLTAELEADAARFEVEHLATMKAIDDDVSDGEEDAKIAAMIAETKACLHRLCLAEPFQEGGGSCVSG